MNKYLNNYLGKRINWKIKIVEEIPVSQNGKYKLLIDKTNNN